MKDLLKISLVLAFALFVSMSVKAQTTSEVGGTITVNVPAHLELMVPTPNVTFVWDEYGATSQQVQNVGVQVKSNVLWKLSVYSLNDNIVHTDQVHVIPIGNITINGVVETGTLRNSYAEARILLSEGNMALSNITFTLAGLGNQFAGVYSCGINYYLQTR